jgi:hypothetical protein
VAGLAGCLYLVHSLAALAAFLPYDAIVSPGVLLRWSARAGLVVAATAVVALYSLIAAEVLRGYGTVLATLLGFAIAVALAALLVRVYRRG